MRKAGSGKQAAGRRKRVAREVWEHLRKDKLAQWYGIELLEMREGYAKCAMVLRDEMTNSNGVAHGGALFTLADYAFAAACNSYGQLAVALEVKINFVQAVEPGARLIAEAVEEALSARIGLYRLTVRDDAGQLIAAAQATAYRKQEWFGR